MSLDGELPPLLRTRRIGRALRFLPSCASTNDEAAAWARAGAPSGAVVIADQQSRGRGRFGRTWHSPPGDDLYFSTVLRPSLPPRAAPPLTLAVAVALAEAVASQGVEPELKWPNDLLLDGKKAAGILTEMVATVERVEFVVVGIGVNLNARHFPDELSARATSIALAAGRPVERAPFCAELCARLEDWYERFVDGGARPIADAWKRHARLFGKPIAVDNGRARVQGVAEDLDEEGALLVRSDGKLVRVVAGEIA